MPKRILVVANDRTVRQTRTRILEREGYSVASAESDDEAIALLESEAFDLVLIGRDPCSVMAGFDQRLRERFPRLLMLKTSDIDSVYATRTTEAKPASILSELTKLLT
jgi:CheY-like chemotaxis protein